MFLAEFLTTALQEKKKEKKTEIQEVVVEVFGSTVVHINCHYNKSLCVPHVNSWWLYLYDAKFVELDG